MAGLQISWIFILPPFHLKSWVIFSGPPGVARGRKKAGKSIFEPFIQCRSKLPLCNFVFRGRFEVIIWHSKKYNFSHFSTGIKRAKFTKSSSLWKINFFARWKKLSFSTRCFKKGHFNTYNNFYIGCNSDAFERLSIVQRCSKLIGSEISFLTLYAMPFGRIYCSSRNIILMIGSQLRSHLTWNEMEEVVFIFNLMASFRPA